MSKSIILDASALIALIYEEKGSDLVEKYMFDAEISAVNLAEVGTYIIKRCGQEKREKKEIAGLIENLSIPVIDFNDSQAYIAAELIEKTVSKGLSLGDRACLALAIQRNGTVLTADKIWQELELGVKIKIIR